MAAAHIAHVAQLHGQTDQRIAQILSQLGIAELGYISRACIIGRHSGCVGLLGRRQRRDGQLRGKRRLRQAGCWRKGSHRSQQGRRELGGGLSLEATVGSGGQDRA